MNDEIKEILDRLDYNEWDVDLYKVPITWCEMYDIRDYITNLEQVNKNQAKRNSRQRLANQKQQELILKLQQENERLKEKYDNSKSHQINYNYFKTLYEKATKDIVIDDLVYKCEDLDNLKKSYEKLYIEKADYKSRCKKAVEEINYWGIDKEHNDDSAMRCALNNLLNILQNGSDNKC